MNCLNVLSDIERRFTFISAEISSLQQVADLGTTGVAGYERHNKKFRMQLGKLGSDLETLITGRDLADRAGNLALKKYQKTQAGHHLDQAGESKRKALKLSSGISDARRKSHEHRDTLLSLADRGQAAFQEATEVPDPAQALRSRIQELYSDLTPLRDLLVSIRTKAKDKS